MLFFEKVCTAGPGPAAEQKTKRNRRFSSRPSTGEGAALSRRLLRKSKLQLSGLPASGQLRTSMETWGLAGTRGRRSPARGSTRRPSVDSAWGGAALEDAGGPTATGRLRLAPGGSGWMVHHAGAGCAGSPRSAAVPPRNAGRSPRLCAEQPSLGDGGARKRACRTSFISQGEPSWRSWTTMVGTSLPDGTASVDFRRLRASDFRRS